VFDIEIIHDGFLVLPYCPYIERPMKVSAILRSLRDNTYRRAVLLNQAYIIAFPSYRLTNLWTIEADLISVKDYDSREVSASITDRVSENIIDCWLRYGLPSRTQEKHYAKHGWDYWCHSAGFYSYCKRIKPMHVVNCCEAIRDILNDALAVSKPKPTIEELESDYGESDD